MVFSRFIWTIILTVAFITFTAILLGIYLQKPGYPVTASMLIILLAAETLALIIYLMRIRKDLLKLVNALRNEDPTLQFASERGDPYFSAIHRGFNEIIRNFRLVRLDKETEQRFFEATVNHVQFGLLAFNQKGEVALVNHAMLDLFGIPYLEHIDNLEDVAPQLPARIRQLVLQKESLEKIELAGVVCHLIFLASRFSLKQEEITLISVRDISREIDRNELEAWQKLMRILRHEILNSVSPIKLISANLSEMLGGDGRTISIDSLTKGEISTIKTGFETIHRRAAGLSNFLDAYSNLYRVPELRMEPVGVFELLNRIDALFHEQFCQAGVKHSVECPEEDCSIVMDERMIEQVLINLVKNALYAVRSTRDKVISLSCSKINNKGHLITVADNGTGITKDQLDNIFIPFYSTHGDGSGIGLSFSQHVMRLHQGRINVRTAPGKGSQFQLVFR